MTNLATPDAPVRRPRRHAAPASDANRLAARRTLLALLASGLGIVPLKGLFSDSGWLIDVWLSMVVVVGPAAFIRLRRAPGALDIWPGIVLLVPWLTLRFLHESALAGIIPTGDTWTQLSALMTNLHETTRDEVAPIHTTVAVRLVVCALLGLLAALVDLIAVVGRRGALAGVPLLIVYTVAGAVPRHPVAWVWFAFAALAFLLLLAVDARDDLEHWGRRVRADGERRPARTALAVSTPRIAAAAIVAAVLLPLLVPGEPRNLLADAFHRGGDSEVGGFGAGGNGGSITPFAGLHGQLNAANPKKLADVHMVGGGKTVPFYLRVNVLSKYTDDGWGVASHGDTSSIGGDQYPIQAGGTPNAVELEARVRISGMTGNPPVFGTPTAIDGLSQDTTWSQQDQILLGSNLDDNVQFTEKFQQPAPTIAQLDGASDFIDPSVRSQLTLPKNFPDFARNLTNDKIAGATTQYAKARAISDFFADPTQRFAYDVKTKDGDSNSRLVDFLQNRIGYCQQYAAAMAVMLRSAGVPSRVVLGYMHERPDRDGNFSVSTSDAHAWVEAWFDGVGWVPFDPTPAAGLTGSANDLAWAPHDAQSAQPSDATSSAPSATRTTPTSAASAAPTTKASTEAKAARETGSSPLAGWLLGGAALVVVLALLPGAVRWSRRRQRCLAARRSGDADLLWDELSDTAVDLGFVWSPARSPRQVADWLTKDAPASARSLQTLATAVEQRRYAAASSHHGPNASGGDDMVDALRSVTDELRHNRSGRIRFRARFWPASLRWTTAFGGGARRRR